MEYKTVKKTTGSFKSHEDFIEQNLTERTKRMIFECLYVIRSEKIKCIAERRNDYSYVRRFTINEKSQTMEVGSVQNLKKLTINTIRRTELRNFTITLINEI